MEWKKVGVFLKILARKPIGMRRLGRSRRRWEDNIRMNPKK